LVGFIVDCGESKSFAAIGANSIEKQTYVAKNHVGR
jgi:hypothetical protein